MPEKVLIHSRFPKALMVRIAQHFELMDSSGKPAAEVFSAEQLSDVKALITAGGTPLGAAALDMLPSLRAIICYGTGYDGIDFASVAKRNIVVGHSPAANAAAVVTRVRRKTRPPAARSCRMPMKRVQPSLPTTLR